LTKITSTVIESGGHSLSVSLSVSVSLSLSLLVAPTLEHRASVKRFVSLEFLNLGQPVGFLARRLADTYTNRINADKHPCLEWDSNP
jgi:hypothetical protein